MEVSKLIKVEDGFVVRTFMNDFIGYESKELYKIAFEIEEKDDSYLYYMALAPPQTSRGVIFTSCSYLLPDYVGDTAL